MVIRDLRYNTILASVVLFYSVIGFPIVLRECPGNLTLVKGVCTSDCEAGACSHSDLREDCHYAARGYFVSNGGATSQTICPAGTFSSSQGSAECQRCAPAMFSISGSSSCYYCSAGASTLDHITCFECPLGLYSAYHDPCLLAPSGNYITPNIFSGRGATSYAPCSPGTDSKEGATGIQSTACTICPVNTFGLGGQPCQACSSGEISLAGSTSAADCVPALVYASLYIIYEYQVGNHPSTDFSYTNEFTFEPMDTINDLVQRLPHKSHITLIDLAYRGRGGGTELALSLTTSSNGWVTSRNANTKLSTLVPVSDVFLLYVYTTDRQ